MVDLRGYILAVSVMLLPLLLRFLRRHPVGNDIVNVMIHLAAVGGLFILPVLRAEHMDSRTDSIHDEGISR